MNDARAASLLERLGELAGIEPSYRNYFGAETVASPETTRAILAALGFDVDDAQGLKKTVAALESAPWRRRIDPVTIAMHGTVARIGIVSAEAPFPATIEWNLTEEHGRKHNGIWSRSAQPAVGERIIEDERRERRLFDLPPTLPLGYHRLEVHGFGQADFIVAPSRCYLPPAVAGGAKLWGVSAQLYGLRSQRNWGMGDFTDLRTLVTAAHGIGAAAVGVNPLHELDPHNPDAASPYSPSSRLHLNVAYLDVEAVPDFQDSRDAQRLASETAFVRRLRELRAAPLVDYGGVAACKRPVLELCYRSFRRRHLSARSERARAFWAFVAEGGEKLERLAIYEALREWIGYGEHSWSWETWPQGLRDPRSADVHAFATEQRERVEFFCYLQWNADLQLAGAASACSRMPVGLYRDLAVGVDGASAETWADPESLVRGVTVGAPPDALNVHGQNWGLLPFHPMVLRKRGFAPFVALIRANMRHAGALRIDHAMSLQRLFWIPAGRSASEGAYVRYPLAELLALVALESERNRCLVIGEDLGTVPEGFRERLQWSRIFSYRLLYFERDHDGAFKPPDEYPPLALVSTGTHDLPTLPGFWKGEDLLLRARLALLRSDTSLDQEQRLRQHERAALIAALLKDGDVAHALAERLRIAEANASAEDLRQLVEAAYHFLAKSRSRLLMASLEDVLGVLEQSNVPGTTSEHPNWRRKLPMEVEALARDERVTNFAAALHNERALSAPPTVPSATYRLQFHGGFRFTDAQRIVPYLHALGISHVYASPIFAARPGSTHGYDVVDHAALNPELGTRADFEDFVAELHRSAMGLVVDFVPNHTGIGAENPWWQDVLEWGRASPYAAFFDIDWNPAQRALRGKLLLPFLGAPYGDVLERGELRLAFDSSGGTFALIYEDQRFPLAPHTYASVLRFAADAAALRREPAAEAELRALCWSFERCLPKRGATVDVLRQHAGEAKRRLTLASRAAAIAQALEDALKRLAGKPGAPSSFEELHRLVLAQHYRPAFWRVALDEINYRRFFDINDLAGLRMEVAECFALVHRFVFRLIEDGLVQGLRIDHVDGLYDPKAYTTLLRIRAAALDYPLYLIVEKILARHESLRDDWLVAGTTGYEFLNAVNGLFVDAQSERRMEAMYRAFTAERRTFEEILAESKRLIMDVNLASELEVLANQLDRIAQTDRRSSDLTRVVLRDALADVIEAFPVYRTYVDGDGASAEDRRYLDWALAQARKRTSALDLNVFTFLEAILSTDATRDPRSRYRMRDVVHFAMKFQQYTAPVMAKAYEDTAFYRYARLISLNEVGGDPRRFGVSVSAFHRTMRDRAAKTPYALSSTATHDAKRGEDARLRIDALSELTARARRALVRLERINRRHKRDVDGSSAPDRLDEWFLYQTLIGAWPLEALDAEPSEPIASPAFTERIQTTMRKAIREAKRHTSWANPLLAYEDATAAFVAAVLGESRDSPFWLEFRRIAEPAARIAMVHGLAQVVLKLTAPGAPDVYQGAELWDFSLVDPDNRRPVDWILRERIAASLPARGEESSAVAAALLGNWRDGRVKMFVTRTLLRLRETRREMFLNDEYAALETVGQYAGHVVALERRGAIAIVPRLVGALGGDVTPPLGATWGDTGVLTSHRRTAQSYRDLFTREIVRTSGEPLRVAEVLSHFPVAVLLPEDEA